MSSVTSLIREDKEFFATLSGIRVALKASEPYPLLVNGLAGGAEDAFLTEACLELVREIKSPILILTSTPAERHRVAELISEGGMRAFEFKERELIFHNVSASCDVDRERLSVLSKIIKGECDVVVSTPSAAISFTVPNEILKERSVTLAVGAEIEPASLASSLLSIGYSRTDMVESAGQFSVRGDIFDIWYSAVEPPVRVEFFGDEIDRIACFDSETQRSRDSIDKIEILPACEVMTDAAARAAIAKELEALIASAKDDAVVEKLSYELTCVKGGLTVDARDKYINLIYKKPATLFDYLGERTAIFTLDTNGCREEVKRYSSHLGGSISDLIEKGLVKKEHARLSRTEADLTRALDRHATVHLNAFGGGGFVHTGGIYAFRVRRSTSYGGNPRLLADDVRELMTSAYKVLILSPTHQGAASVAADLEAAGIYATVIEDTSKFAPSRIEGRSVFVGVGTESGFELIVPRIVVLSVASVEGRAVMEKRRRQRILKRVGGAGKRLMSHADLSVGDYVVHASYGIGLFEGIEAVTVDGVTRDYITIRYAGTDKLFVPADKLDLIGKYIGERDNNGQVKLSKMGGGDWNRAKSRAKAAARDIARDLIRLYAERQRTPGFAFPADSDMERDFAAGFGYEETDSQLVAIEEIKADMMRPVPMQRLLCGDVGFGKTEVALRAAFKAIMGGKQVAILVPTTILALQHYTTATSRMRDFPVTVEMISRFKTAREQEKIIKRVAKGEIDILIGTHKLLSKKIQFRDLGLLIIDEEQRFGVAQKEKLREMASAVDTLTLSATPIPRTLNMAMNGISDMSILDEAPGERRPVQTYVTEYDEGIINDAIRRELLRQGQVLYLYNRVEDIDIVATRIMNDHPEARVAIAHGGMERDELEDIWQSLVAAEIDILVCTTIVETGIDLPLANTLIIENADKMGLSQLHQIRGRVGRSERQAYAYFTYRKGKALTEIAEKRLSAIREFATFGAGFKVALRDLEIRGAGNLLGAEQHGYIESVGYDLYVRLLSEAVLEERGEVPKRQEDATVDIRVSAHIPETYISVSAQRMEMYKKISLIEDEIDAEDVTDELIDRFGEMPRETMTLIKVSLVRALSTKAGLTRVEYRDGVLNFHQKTLDLGMWSEVFVKHPRLAFRGATAPVVTCKLMRGERPLDVAADVLGEYKKVLEREDKGENNGKEK